MLFILFFLQLLQLYGTNAFDFPSCLFLLQYLPELCHMFRLIWINALFMVKPIWGFHISIVIAFFIIALSSKKQPNQVNYNICINFSQEKYCHWDFCFVLAAFQKFSESIQEYFPWFFSCRTHMFSICRQNTWVCEKKLFYTL